MLLLTSVWLLQFPALGKGGRARGAVGGQSEVRTAVPTVSSCEDAPVPCDKLGIGNSAQVGGSLFLGSAAAFPWAAPFSGDGILATAQGCTALPWC